MDPVAAAAAAAAAAAQSDSDDPDFQPAQVAESDVDSAADDATETTAKAAAASSQVNGAAASSATPAEKGHLTSNGEIKANGDKSSDGAKTNNVASSDVDKALATARAAAAAVTARKESTSSDALWRQFNKSAPRRKRATNSGLDAWLGSTTKAAPEAEKPKVKASLPRLDEAAEASARAAAAVEEQHKKQLEDERPRKRQKIGTGLEAVLQAAKAGSVAPSTLDKTKSDWKSFKSADQEVTDELEAYKKDKTRYTERVDFLERTAVREWEVEQAGKKGRR